MPPCASEHGSRPAPRRAAFLTSAGGLTDEEAGDLLRQVDQAAATSHRVRLAIERRRRVAS